MSNPGNYSYLKRDLESSSNQNTQHPAKRRAVENQPSIDQGSIRFLAAPGPRSTSYADLSTHVSQQGVSYNIGGRARVDIHTGTSITQHVSSARPVSPLVNSINRSRNAEYNMTRNVARRPCTHNTRITVLDKMEAWFREDPARLYWLSGIAGTGKTTLAFSFSEKMKAQGNLGATFFCSRSLDDCRDVNMIIPTIAHQLATQYPPFGEELTRVLERDPDIFQRGLDVQLQSLIIEPWNSQASNLPSNIVIVLDALDECDGGHSSFLKIIFSNVAKLPFKLLITSRPDFSIRETMKAKDPDTLSTFILHEVEKDMVEADIATYLEEQLSEKVSPDIIDELKILSGSFFIIAATLAKLFTSGNINPQTRLQALKTSMATGNKALATLDELYYGVLYTALCVDELSAEEVQEIKDVLFMVICARNPLTVLGLAEILGIPTKELRRRLDSLHSVLSIPARNDLPVVIFHASLADFMQDISRSNKFFCDPDQFHIKITNWCLKVLNGQLRQRIRKPINFSLSPALSTNIPQASLEYAAVYWVAHLALSDDSSRKAIFDIIFDILALHVLHWIEFMSWLGQLSVVIQGLESLLDMVDEGSSLAVVAYEYLRMVQYYYDSIHYNSEGIYELIGFAPLQCPLRSLHASLFAKCPKVLCGLPTDWPALERVINIDSGRIYSIAISQDGSRMVSGSEDSTVRIWNIRKHSEECALTGHTGEVYSVAITQNGSRVVSGSDDGTIRIWDVLTNKVVFTLEASGPVSAVAISSDEKYLASGDLTGKIQLWNTADGQLLRTLDGHTLLIWSLSFVPNTPNFVSGSGDGTSRVWNALTGETKSTLHSHTRCVNSVACSPSGDRIVTGSDDYTARLWNMDGQQLQILQGHTELVWAVAFMPDGKRVVTGSDDCTLRVWDADTGHTLHTFTATDAVRSVAIFPGGLKIASSSGSQINIWSMRSLNSQVTANETARVTTIEADRMEFSSDGQRVMLLPSLQILDTSTLDERVVLNSQNSEHDRGAWSATRRRVAGSTDRGYKIEVWELNGDDGIVGKPLTLIGHTGGIHHISFSHNERHLCSASSDRTVYVWDLTTGEPVHALQHPDKVYCASFSHNDTQLVSHGETTIHVWTTQTGEQLYKIDTTAIYSCAFTPDDQCIITCNTELPGYTTTIWNAQTGEKKNAHEGYNYWTTLKDGSSYALSNDGWVCQFARFGDTPPSRLCWIPHQYRPKIWLPNNILFSLSSQGVQLCLPRRDGLITLIIPQGPLG